MLPIPFSVTLFARHVPPLKLMMAVLFVSVRVMSLASNTPPFRFMTLVEFAPMPILTGSVFTQITVPPFCVKTALP